MEMEVAYQDLESGQSLIDVVVSVGENILLGGMAVLRAEVEINSHALKGSRRRVVEREVLQFAADSATRRFHTCVRDAEWLIAFFAIRLPNSDREGGVAVLAVIDVAEIGFHFAGEEELVGWREERRGSRRSLRGSRGDCARASPTPSRFTEPPKAYCCQAAQCRARRFC